MKTMSSMALAAAAIGLLFPGDTSAATCPATTKVTVVGKSPDLTGVTWTSPKAVAFRNESVHTTSIYVYLSNFEAPAKTAFEAYKGKPKNPGEAQLSFTLTRQVPGAKQGLEVPPGTFDFTKGQGQVERNGSVEIRLPGGKALQLQASKTQGSFELTSSGPKQACGTFKLEDPWTQISGEFVADFPQ